MMAHVGEVTPGTSLGATIPTYFSHTMCNALIDMGTTRSCVSEACYHTLILEI